MLTIHSIEKVQVKVTNGESMGNEGRAPKVLLSIHGTQFTIADYISGLAGYDMVLGVAWLQTLRSILYNFQELSMQSVWKDQNVTLRGLANSKLIEEGGIHGGSSSKNKGVVLQLLQGTRPDLIQPPRKKIQSLLQ